VHVEIESKVPESQDTPLTMAAETCSRRHTGAPTTVCLMKSLSAHTSSTWGPGKQHDHHNYE
jgi:hypothetical protein